LLKNIINNDMLLKKKELNNKEALITEQLTTVYDPEIPVNIYDLGLIYDVSVDDAGNALILMTLTAPNCPAVDTMIDEIVLKTSSLEGINKATVTITFQPPWNTSRMSEEARLILGWM
jgi:FeS assembly SUF system protein